MKPKRKNRPNIRRPNFLMEWMIWNIGVILLGVVFAGFLGIIVGTPLAFLIAFFLPLANTLETLSFTFALVFASTIYLFLSAGQAIAIQTYVKDFPSRSWGRYSLFAGVVFGIIFALWMHFIQSRTLATWESFVLFVGVLSVIQYGVLRRVVNIASLWIVSNILAGLCLWVGVEILIANQV